MANSLPDRILIIVLQIFIVGIILTGSLPISLVKNSPANLVFEGIIFYWSIYYPRLMSPAFLFILGIIQDCLYGNILGCNALVNLLSQYLIMSQGRLFIKQSFLVVWFAFVLFVLGINLMKSSLFFLTNGKFLFNYTITLHCIFAVVLYPLLHSVFGRINLFLTNIKYHAK